MNVVDLFSGIGGFSLGLEWAGFKTVAFCEIDKDCQKVLKKHWPDVPVYEDIRKLDGSEFDDIGLICGGYPCQPFSTAGKREGEKDDRHLWPEMYRIIKAVKPRWVIAENVAGHISMGLDAVLSDLEAENYTCWPFVIPACAVDARHRRDRVWIVGHAEHNGLSPAEKPGGTDEAGHDNAKRQNKAGKPQGTSGRYRDENVASSEGVAVRAGLCASGSTKQRGRRSGNSGGAEDMANTNSIATQRMEQRPQSGEHKRSSRLFSGTRSLPKPTAWAVEPDVGRVAHGVSRRVDRLRGLGNAVVPQIPELIGRAIMEVEHEIR